MRADHGDDATTGPWTKPGTREHVLHFDIPPAGAEGLNRPMSSDFTLVTPVALPAGSRLVGLYASTDLADAFSIRLPAGTADDAEVLARFIFAQQAPWIHALMRLRDALVAGFGLKTARQLATLAGEAGSARLGIFSIYGRSEAEIVLGEDDRHLDFRVSVLCSGDDAAEDARHLVLSTVVRCHNRLGRVYIALIAPFHRLVVRSSLRRAARMGWPQARTAVSPRRPGMDRAAHCEAEPIAPCLAEPGRPTDAAS